MRAPRHSQSFSVKEVNVMAFVASVLSMGGDPSHLVKRKEFGTVASKFKRMKDGGESYTARIRREAPDNELAVVEAVRSGVVKRSEIAKLLGISPIRARGALIRARNKGLLELDADGKVWKMAAAETADGDGRAGKL